MNKKQTQSKQSSAQGNPHEPSAMTQDSEHSQDSVKLITNSQSDKL